MITVCRIEDLPPGGSVRPPHTSSFDREAGYVVLHATAGEQA